MNLLDQSDQLDQWDQWDKAQDIHIFDKYGNKWDLIEPQKDADA